ncbi:glycosyl hydrolase family 18 protein [Paenibacillus sp. GP183]|uniref:glycosyl hydrolase family 18 protein n=1 Tax=Paenibacillus sp. GP183 TaxID=1882751 RepID=UPI000895AA2C|nr:glycosyl hydrolase family 18 protein [Paenibacillus sp. GP183]SEC46156.1 spore germination protein [Paenibacillus sp. GP183]
MRIHVVQPGQTLYQISHMYGVPAKKIADANEISIDKTLVVGQALVIPVAGDSKPRRSAEINAYLDIRGSEVAPNLVQSATQAAPHLTYLAPFSFQIKRDGSLKAPPLDNLQEIARQNHVTLMMVVTNMENDQFSADLGALFLNNAELQNTLLNNILQTARRLNFRDIHFDIEHLRPQDKDAYNSFLRKAANQIHQAGFLISTALAPKTSAAQTGAWYSAHDYKTHGQIVDFVVIMTYEWGYSGGPPMAVSPIGSVRNVLQYAISEMPASKIMMGQNLYGYDWTLPYVPGGRFAKALSPQAAIDLARQVHAAIQYDYTAQAPHFSYWDNQGKHHIVWFEDARSIQAKFNLVKELSLRGVSYWKLGLSFPQNWLLIDDNFNVTKRANRIVLRQ